MLVPVRGARVGKAGPQEFAEGTGNTLALRRVVVSGRPMYNCFLTEAHTSFCMYQILYNERLG